VSFNLAQLQDLLRQVGWPDIMVNSTSGRVPLIALMASIGLAESSGNPLARNTSGEDSVGLWQINRRAHPESSVAGLQDPSLNAGVALQIYNSEGLRAWGAYTDGSYRTRGNFQASLAAYNEGAPGTTPSIENGGDVGSPDSWAPFPPFDGPLPIYQEQSIWTGNIGLIAVGVLGVAVLIRLLSR